MSPKAERWYVLTIHERQVNVVPAPYKDSTRADRIKSVLPRSEGWTHFEFAATRVAGNQYEARAIAERARQALEEVGGVPA